MLTQVARLALVVLLIGVIGCDSATTSPADETTQSADESSSKERSNSEVASGLASRHFVFARIQDTVLPIQRGEKYEDPLDQALQSAELGEVTGGGSQLTKDGSVAWVGVDIELDDLEQGIPFVKRKLIELGAPRGSVLEYSKHEQPVETPIHE